MPDPHNSNNLHELEPKATIAASLAELVRERHELEHRLASKIQGELSGFHRRTGVPVSQVDVSIFDVQRLGLPDETAVAGVGVKLKLE